ncbi:hypothetical protein V6U81_11200 [Micromonospora sp. CPCC 205711]|uniref:hypothetical protein n=1 Tax=Micromonospora sp. CPCC 205547 TaxID=3122400 RepID=UPI002FF0E933
MARHGLAIGTTSLLAALALGVAGCGPAQVAEDTSKAAAVDVAAAMGVEGQALAAMGFDPTELEPVAAAGAAPSGSPAPEASAGGKGKRGERAEEWRKRRQARVLLRKNTLHGEAVVQTRDGGTKTVAVQRGQVTAIDGDSMTVKSTDGFTMTWTFGEDLKVVERRNTVQSTDIKVGTTVGVAGAKDGDNAMARLIVVPLKQK